MTTVRRSILIAKRLFVRTAHTCMHACMHDVTLLTRWAQMLLWLSSSTSSFLLSRTTSVFAGRKKKSKCSALMFFLVQAKYRRTANLTDYFFCSLLLQSVMSNYGKVAEFRSCINSEKVSDRKTTIVIIITIIPEWPVRRNPSYLHTAYLGLFVMVWEQISIIIIIITVENVAVNLSITL